MDSASSYLKSERDSATQGVMPLKGKPLNTFDLDFIEAYENEEIQTLINLLGCGVGSKFNMSKLRYNKIIITADADADGNHIEILLIGFFLKHLPKLIENGVIYRAIAPLYGAQVGREYKMFFSEVELESYEKKYGKLKSLDRYKGLGAMSEEQVEKYLMAHETRKIEKVSLDNLHEMEELFEIFLGKSEVGKALRKELVRTGELV